MIAASLAWSTSVTKSFTCFCEIRTDSTSSAARLMMAPAARAALTATLSMGWRLGEDIYFLRTGTKNRPAMRTVRMQVILPD